MISRCLPALRSLSVSDARPAAAIVLAAGKGTRMHSRTPKVLHGFAGRSLVGHVLAAVAPLSPERTVVIVGHGRDQVEAHLKAAAPGVRCVEQTEQRGTGHAVSVALEALTDLGEEDTVLVLSGDTPLLQTSTLKSLLEAHVDGAASATVLTAVVADPFGYGRVVRAEDGSFASIVEQRDGDDETLKINEINAGLYVFVAGELRKALTLVDDNNAQHEQYLTDVFVVLRNQGRHVVAHAALDPLEIGGVNDRRQLADAAGLYNARLIDAAMAAGVTVVDPATTWLDHSVTLAPDVTLLPGTRLHGATRVDEGSVIGPDTTLIDTAVGKSARIQSSTCSGAEVGDEASVGPYSFLRPGATLLRGSRVGAFVEVKKSVIGEGSKVPHLSYIGDATIGARSNIGAASVTVNYDGVDKHETVIGDDVRIGSDTMLIAPVTVGDGAYTAAGSVITGDVPAGALGVGRARQRNIDGWVKRRRGAKASAKPTSDLSGDIGPGDMGEAQQ